MGLDTLPERKVLIVTLEPVAGKMAGPAIRCLELGRQLARDFAVTVFSPQRHTQGETDSGSVRIVSGGSKTVLYNLAHEADIIFLQANVLKPFPSLAKMDKYLILDLYDPYLFSLFEQYEDNPATAASSYRLMHQVLEKHMLAADFSICASERQRDYWMGRFCALGRLTPQVYKLDRTLRNVIDVVPFGVQDAAPAATEHGIKGKVDGIGMDDPLLLWGGGIWDWFDPLTIIRAVKLATERIPNLRLYFMGIKSPNPAVPLMPMVAKAQHVAQELQLLNKHVFFADGWVDYDQRANYLLDADVAVSAHFDVIETRYSFRTRILDYFWAGLPILTSTGDELAELIQREGAGFALPYEDVAAWSDAIVKLLADSELKSRCKAASARLAEQFHWSNAARPLVNFCNDPHRLPPHTKVTMPSLLERAHAVYSRGGKDLVMRRSKELLGDLLR